MDINTFPSSTQPTTLKKKPLSSIKLNNKNVKQLIKNQCLEKGFTCWEKGQLILFIFSYQPLSPF